MEVGTYYVAFIKGMDVDANILIQNQATIMWMEMDLYKWHSYKINWYMDINGICMNIIHVDLIDNHMIAEFILATLICTHV